MELVEQHIHAIHLNILLDRQHYTCNNDEYLVLI